MIIEMKNIKKSFGANNVLKDVSFKIQGGEICGLLGENGAGKSTLMNILGGVHQTDSGTIEVDGKQVQFNTPAQSLNAGIAFIHQELNLINDLPIYENLFIGRELKTPKGRLDFEGMIRAAEQIFKEMNINLDPRTMVYKLDSSYKQIIEICRALIMDASIIIMDEPTASLTEQEIERVFTMMKALRARNVGIIFISHKLNEVKEFCNKYIVLRNGNLVAEGLVDKVTTNELARSMVGFDVRTESLRRNRELGNEILRLESLTDKGSFSDINLSVKSGEILGVTGLLGDGRSQLFQSVFGANDVPSGKIFLHGKEVVISSTSQALELGIAYLPRNRKENAILKDMNIIENASITTWPKFSKKGIINRQTHEELFAKQREALRLKMGKLTDSITSLSGGNQQKVVLAKWLAASPDLLILDNPTQGVDVGAKEDMYDIIMELAQKNIAIIVLSGEAQEIIRLCDRSLVMYHGKIQGELIGDEMNEHSMMHLATGG